VNDEIFFDQMTLAERPAVLSFLAKAFPDNPRQSDERFWNWHFLENPNTPPSEIPVWLARAGERIVGQLATIPVRLELAGETVPAVCLLDLIVDPEFRRRGIMKSLISQVNKKYQYMWGTATRRQHSAAMVTGLGWKVFSPVPRFHRVLFPGNAVKEIARYSTVREAVNAAFLPLRGRHKLSAAEQGKVRPVSQINESFDTLWEAARSQWPCAIARTAKYLRWQFEQQPYKRFELLGYFDGDEMLGYAVMFFRRPSSGVVDKASISDICYHPRSPAKVADALVRSAVNLAVERRAGAIVTDALDHLLSERLRALGFWPVKSGLEIMAIGPGHHDSLYDSNSWYFTRGDSDISIFEEPNVAKVT